MVFEVIFAGLGNILGFEQVVALLFLFSFLLLAVSRGVGVTALIVTSFLSIYLFATNAIEGRFLIDNAWFVVTVMIFGLFLGFMFVVFWFRD